MPILTADERVGTVVGGKYALERILGAGGMGVVYAGMHLRLRRPVAIKFLHPQHASEQQLVERFFVEAQAVARLQHRNVVEVHDVDRSDDGAAYMVLELLTGEPVTQLMSRCGQLSIAETLALFLPILDALARAHDHAIIHRDLKPDNLYLARGTDGSFVPKILDFGIAKLLDGSGAPTTETGIIGTPAYMAPERVMGKRDLGGWTDVWSMGVLLFECLTGRHPIDIPPDTPPTGVMMTIVTSAPRSLAQFLPSAPAELVTAVDRSLAIEPTLRWQNARELGAALARVPPGDTRSADAILGVLAARGASDVATTIDLPTIVMREPTTQRRAAGRAWVWYAVFAALVALAGSATLAWSLTRDDTDAIRVTPLAQTPATGPASPVVLESPTAPTIVTPAVESSPVIVPPRVEPPPSQPSEARRAPRPRRPTHPGPEGEQVTPTGRAGQVSLDDF